MFVEQLTLRDFRNYDEVQFAPATEGITLLVGPNGAGKTNLLESIGWLATAKSFRGAPNEMLVRHGQTTAGISTKLGGRLTPVTIEAQIPTSGRAKIVVNNKSIRRFRDVAEYVRIVVFTPDDLELIKGSPGGRRDFLDYLLSSVHAKHDATISDYERTLRQRNSFLSQLSERPTRAEFETLDVWDEQLAIAGEQLVEARAELLSQLVPYADDAYKQLAARAYERISIVYSSKWQQVGMRQALIDRRQLDLIRGTTSVGPHRDDLEIELGGLPARQSASQGQQRSIALALRLASHSVLSEEWDSKPILLLDDLFSELDDRRAAALLKLLPEGQAILSTTGRLPEGIDPTLVIGVEDAHLQMRN